MQWLPGSRWSRIGQCSDPVGPQVARRPRSSITASQGLDTVANWRKELTAWHDLATGTSRRVQTSVVWKDYLHSLIFHGTRKHSCSFWRGFYWLLLFDLLMCDFCSLSNALLPKHASPYLPLHLVISELCLCILIMFLQSEHHRGLERLDVGPHHRS